MCQRLVLVYRVAHRVLDHLQLHRWSFLRQPEFCRNPQKILRPRRSFFAIKTFNVRILRHLLIKLFISAVQFELMLCKSQNIHQELMPKNVAKYHVPNAMAIYNFGFYKKAKIWYVIMSSFFEATFNFDMYTAYGKHLFVGMMNLNPSDIDPTSNILS